MGIRNDQIGNKDGGIILVLLRIILILLGGIGGCVGNSHIGSTGTGNRQLTGVIGDFGDGGSLGHSQLSTGGGLGHGDALHSTGHIGLHIGSGHFQGGDSGVLSHGNGGGSSGLGHGYAGDLTHDLNGSGGSGYLDGLHLGGLGHGDSGFLGFFRYGDGLDLTGNGDSGLGGSHGDGGGHSLLLHGHVGLGHDDNGINVSAFTQDNLGALSAGSHQQARGQLRILNGNGHGSDDQDQTVRICGDLGVFRDVLSDFAFLIAQLGCEIGELGGHCRGRQHTQH